MDPPLQKSGEKSFESSKMIFGETTRFLHSVWVSVLGTDKQKTVREPDITRLFHAVEIYPSKSQVYEMLHYSPQQSERLAQESEGSALAQDFLTFGQFCFFATELKRKYVEADDDDTSSKAKSSRGPDSGQGSIEVPAGGGGHPSSEDGPVNTPTSSNSSSCSAGLNKKSSPESRSQKSSSTTSAYDVFLGGSCNPTTWRQDTAIPHLKGHDLTYYNPQQDNWVPAMIKLEQDAMETSKVLLYFLTNKTRNVASMMEVAYFAGGAPNRDRKLVVALEPYPDDGTLVEIREGERLGRDEQDNLADGLNRVWDLLERQGIPVCPNLDVALTNTVKLIQENMTADQLTLEDAVQPVRHAHLTIGDKMVRMRTDFSQYDLGGSGKISLTDLKMAFKSHTGHKRDLGQKDLRAIVRAVGGGGEASESEAVSTSRLSSGSVSRQTCDQVKLDFTAFCCIVAEFKSSSSRLFGSQQQSAKTTSQGAGGALHRKQAGQGASSAQHKRSLFSIPKKIKGWFSTSGSGYGSEAPDPSSAPSRPSRSRGGGSGAASSGSRKDIYLGGSHRLPSGEIIHWRESEAIPRLKKEGLSFIDPLQQQLSVDGGRVMPVEVASMKNCRYLLFNIHPKSTCIYSVIEAAYHCASQPSRVVLCVKELSQEMADGKKLSTIAWRDYNRGRKYLSDYANKEGVPVFEDINEALQCVVDKCRKGDK